jgi:hypothetical protein
MTTTTPATTAAALAEAWTAFWNGELDRAETLLTPDFRIRFGGDRPGDHAGDAVVGPGAMAGFVRDFRAERPDVRFAVDAPPVADGAGFAVRWSASRPGVDVSGIDVVRLDGGRIAEVWSLTGGRRFPA